MEEEKCLECNNSFERCFCNHSRGKIISYYYGCNHRQVEKCPICLGKGIVSHGFYNTTTDTFTSSTCNNEICISCSGRGYIII